MNATENFFELPFLSVKQTASYLQLNEKKIYELANQGTIPATKVTGKWMFPRELKRNCSRLPLKTIRVSSISKGSEVQGKEIC